VTLYGVRYAAMRRRQTTGVCLEAGATSPVTVWLRSPEDIAVSKIGRLGAVDVDDIIALMSLPTASRFEQLACEAQEY
jgi:hypothetical protein